MKQYTPPKIKAVELDPGQAILQVCRAGGIYLDASVTSIMMCSTKTGGVGALCAFTPKLGAGGSTSIDSVSPYCDTSQAFPS